MSSSKTLQSSSVDSQTLLSELSVVSGKVSLPVSSSSDLMNTARRVPPISPPVWENPHPRDTFASRLSSTETCRGVLAVITGQGSDLSGRDALSALCALATANSAAPHHSKGAARTKASLMEDPSVVFLLQILVGHLETFSPRDLCEV